MIAITVAMVIGLFALALIVANAHSPSTSGNPSGPAVRSGPAPELDPNSPAAMQALADQIRTGKPLAPVTGPPADHYASPQGDRASPKAASAEAEAFPDERDAMAAAQREPSRPNLDRLGAIR